jgi:hypothetical protein
MLKEEMDGAAERYPAVPYPPVLIDGLLPPERCSTMWATTMARPTSAS